MIDVFDENRRLLFSVAYRMTGSVADAEDIVQDAWLRWSAVEAAAVEQPKAYLVKTVTNLALNQLTSARARRESYVGPWLPEPLLTSPDTAEEVEMAESVSMAMLVVLETLSPLERAVFLLREVFGYDHAEIAEMLGREESAVRQLAHRAREHVRARRPRYDADPATRAQVVERFRAACAGGDLAEVMAVLAPDVTVWSDGGGIVSAARRPVVGADHVGRWIVGVLGKVEGQEFTARLAEINGELGVLFVLGGVPIGTVSLEVDGDRIAALRIVINPEKMRGVTGQG
ncbi:RNA polymerase sigma-70 factor (ECF subfamily) [Allocatelliglobosispora scoriae]|uniref:RNA polymerase sigma-70 factor (ECF subfamily) n=1 Tax=Allocatelliglobosispora scoriae TaxID=643052 RepID=A0A841BHR5_9ACTN|nr:RNA polymerase sigma-70 factor [Allocatelliglobosispora scoriae]MBB5867165.1 RNA polymerase sigma-70 factor (ECF subfamily) [Allocatelliglobosispora scoriae]